MPLRNPIHVSALVALVVLGVPTVAGAAEIELEVAPTEARYGEANTLTGTVTDAAGMPVAGAPVTLVGRRFPFDGDFHRLDTATTDADGAYRFEREFERNWQVRAVVGEDRSKTRRVYVFPRFTLSFKARNSRVIVLSQRYRVPHGVELKRPTVFYVGRRGRRTAPRAATAEVERVRSGRFVSKAVVRIPAAWKGRFRYASCFRYTVGSGMGRPDAPCPKRFRF
jgi:Carboxypeptidase regulatory-like domain